MSVCTFFGHKECHNLDAQVLRNAIEDLIQQGADLFYVGHQGHFDAMVYSCLKQLHNVYPHIQFFVVLAYLPIKKPDHPETANTLYPEIEGYPKFAIDRRNRWMIHAADHCLCYITHTWGGAYKFARIAKQKGLNIVNLGSAVL